MNGAMELDPLTLDTIGMIPVQRLADQHAQRDHMRSPTSCRRQVHVQLLPANVLGNMPHVMKMNEFHLFRVDTEKAAREGSMSREFVLKMPLEDGYVPYMHSFAQTPNYFVLFKFPLMWDLLGIITSTKILPNMHWTPENGTHVIVIDKRNMTVVRNLWTRPFFAYHHLNAFEQEDGTIACDISTVPCKGSKGGAECNHMNAFQMDTVKNDTFSIPNNTIERFVVPVHDREAEITSRVLTDVSFDLVSLHPDKVGQHYRYAMVSLTMGLVCGGAPS